MCFSKQLAEFAMLVIFALLMLFYGVGEVNCATVHESSIDLHALLDFNSSIKNDPYGALSNWTIDTHFCLWNGVNCSLTRPFRVTGLNLKGYSLEGQLTSSLGNLTFLKKLDLSRNNLLGPLPLLNQLEQLELIHLGNNHLQGTIPDAFTNSSSLKFLDLSTNSLVGAIPPNIGFGSNLIGLGLSGNSLTGTIPPALGNITTLEGLYLRMNQLQGSIPDKIWELPNLEELYLGINSLSGGIPRTFPNMSYLAKLALEFNNFRKMELPSNIGEVLPRLKVLTLNNNMFVGQIPISLENASLLEYIDLSANNFSGQVPTFFGNLPHLRILILGTNELEASDDQSWMFMHALQSCNNLQKLVLNQNNLQGYIPDSIGNLSTNLQYLYLGSNNLSGIVPTSIGNLHGLLWLSLDHNNLTGTIEEWVGRLQNLQGLYLEANEFIGSIPSSIGNLENLTNLLLNDNNFEGIMPPSLGNLSGLLELDLSYNSIYGIIPPDITNLKQLTWLKLSSNNLTGEIPDTLDNFKNLVDIQMDQKFLIGHIPASFSNLYSLKMLNLSHNNLNGTIPTNLSDLPLLSDLDFSYNHLHGEVPRNGVFANAKAVSLSCNLGLCGGVTDLHMPPCSTFSQSTNKRLYYLIKVLIPVFGFMSLILLVYFLLLEKKSSRRKHSSIPLFGEHFHKVSYDDLAQATKNFSESNLVGRGSYGKVYRGKLKEHRMEVAIKVFDLDMQGAERSFLSECEALRSIQHRNLLSILTACSTVDSTGNVFKALVYEFMPNGNLDTWLHHKQDGKHLGLTQRIAVAVNIADALDYLHHDCGRPTIHCDLKPSNILLDDDMNALLGDFGIARFYSGYRTSLTASIGVKGTIGYIAPEYGQGGHASTSGDAYSFGIIMLEMMTGQRPTNPLFNDGLDIIKFVDSKFPHQISEAIDARLLEQCRDFGQGNIEPGNAVYECLVSLLQIALSCGRPLPSERMDMKQAASKLHGIQASYLLACKAK